jgi:hypothetical protein
MMPASAHWKMPPIAKVYEALGALGDGRVHLIDERRASVMSSDGAKTYDVEIDAESREVSSNDNASYWRGYLGYPAIAVMLARGLYSPKAEVISVLKGIPWKELNTRFHNNYDLTLNEVMRRAEKLGYDPAAIKAEAEAVLIALENYAPRRGRRSRPAVRNRRK